MANTTEIAAEAADQAAESAGMPQLDFATFPNQIFWLAVALVVIYLVVSRVALPRIGDILADRQGTITNDLAAAEDLKASALAAEKAYQQALVDARGEAQKIIAEARAGNQAEVDAATAHADAEIAARVAESERRIGEIRATAVDSVSEVARSTAAALIAALSGAVDAKAIAAAVTARLKG